MGVFRYLKAGCRYLLDSNYRYLFNAGMGAYNHIPDDIYLKKIYKAKMGKELNLESPKTYNEKLQWLKLYDRNSAYTMMVDKYEVRKYIAEKLGEEYVIPLLGVWDSPDEIDFDSLPNQFVLKCNHNSGLGMCICRDKSKLDIKKAKRSLWRGLKQDYYLTGREWPYKDVKRRIIAEAYISDANGELNDYKLMCFNGKVKCSFVCSDRYTGKGLHVTFFDRDWNMMPFERSYPSEREGIPKPTRYEKMVELAQVLARDFPFVRVDFYEVDGQIYFGEMTFYPGGGLEAFQPESWDEELGSWIALPEKTLQ